MPNPASLRDYGDDPDLLSRNFELFELVWPGFAEQVHDAQALGLRWDACSTPFVLRNGESPVAHVGVIGVRLLLAGEEMPAGAIHAVCTHPTQRGRGHCRTLMEDALAWCAPRYQTLFLTTDKPALYERFGFRVIAESRFVGPARPGADARPPVRLDFTQEWDPILLDHMLDVRAPPSRVVSLVREKPGFLFYGCRAPLYYIEALDLIVYAEIQDGALRLHDIVARRMPSLEEIATHFPGAYERVEVYFTCDELEHQLTAESHRLDGDDYLLVRGPFVPEDTPIMLPRTARF